MLRPNFSPSRQIITHQDRIVAGQDKYLDTKSKFLPVKTNIDLSSPNYSFARQILTCQDRGCIDLYLSRPTCLGYKRLFVTSFNSNRKTF